MSASIKTRTYARGDSGDVTSHEIRAQGSTEAQGGAVEVCSVSEQRRIRQATGCLQVFGFARKGKELLTSFQGLRVFKRTEREGTRSLVCFFVIGFVWYSHRKCCNVTPCFPKSREHTCIGWRSHSHHSFNDFLKTHRGFFSLMSAANIMLAHCQSMY